MPRASDPVYCTAGTADLCEVLLRDAAKRQEEEAVYANRHGYSKHRPARCALYATDEAEHALKRLRPRDFETPVGITKEIDFRFRPARAARRWPRTNRRSRFTAST